MRPGTVRTATAALAALLAAASVTGCNAQGEASLNATEHEREQREMEAREIRWFLALFEVEREVSHYPQLIADLTDSGASVSHVETVARPYFDVPREQLRIDGRTVYVYEFGTAIKARAAAQMVNPDGFSVRRGGFGGVPEATFLMAWMGAPRYYQEGNLIVVYAGRDEQTQAVLEDLLGPWFAGR